MSLPQANMELEAITPEFVERALRQWKQSQNPSAASLDLHLLSAASPVERSFQLHDLIFSTVTQAMERCRQAERLQRANRSPLSTEAVRESLAADFGCNNSELEAWSALYHRYLHLTSTNISVQDLAQAAHITPRQFRRQLEAGLDRLVNTLRRAEWDSHRLSRTQHLRRHLPAPDYVRLFGVEPLVDMLTARLTDPDGPRFTSIEGLGGIGKTTLAQVAASRLAERGELAALPWISARQEFLDGHGRLSLMRDPARSLDDVIARLAEQLGQDRLAGLATSHKLERLAPLLAHTPHLVIVDNLETLTDVQSLLPALQPLAGETRFLLTSRHSLQDYSYVSVISVPELSLADSASLVESELARRGQPAALNAEAMREIYQTIGGLPLALKLTAAQISHVPPQRVLNELRHARPRAPDQLYTYIYRRAWDMLDDAARQLLLSTLLVSPNGEGAAWMCEMSALPEADFYPALRQLIDYSLLEITGSLEQPLYRLHRLTSTFLQTEILLDWAGAQAEGQSAR